MGIVTRGLIQNCIGNFRITIRPCGCKRQVPECAHGNSIADQIETLTETSKLRVKAVWLFLEEIFKLLACIQWPCNAFRRCSGMARGRCGRRSVLLYGCSKFVKGAFIALIFSRNLFRDGLHAFKAGGGVKIGALLAAMQFERATRAFAFGVKPRLQHRAAIRAAGASNRADHARRSRSNLFLSWMAFMRTLFFFLGLVGMLVAPMFILPVQGNLRDA
jgi:hypothetical protein